MNFQDTIDNQYKFYGVYDLMFKIDHHVFEVIEDENDGYRSYMDSVEVTQDNKLVFLGKSFADVVVRDYTEGDFQGYALVDVIDGHRWLVFGTDHVDDYYPCFRFYYQTKEELLEEAEKQAAQIPHNQQMYDQLSAIQQAIKNGKLGDAEDLLNELVGKLW